MSRDVQDITATWPQPGRGQPALDGWDQAGMRAREAMIHPAAALHIDTIGGSQPGVAAANAPGVWTRRPPSPTYGRDLLHTQLAGTYAFVSPLVAVILGWWLLGEQISGHTLLAAAAIAVGVALIMLHPRSQNQARSAAATGPPHEAPDGSAILVAVEPQNAHSRAVPEKVTVAPERAGTVRSPPSHRAIAGLQNVRSGQSQRVHPPARSRAEGGWARVLPDVRPHSRSHSRSM